MPDIDHDLTVLAQRLRKIVGEEGVHESEPLSERMSTAP